MFGIVATTFSVPIQRFSHPEHHIWFMWIHSATVSWKLLITFMESSFCLQLYKKASCWLFVESHFISMKLKILCYFCRWELLYIIAPFSETGKCKVKTHLFRDSLIQSGVGLKCWLSLCIVWSHPSCFFAQGVTWNIVSISHCLLPPPQLG